MTFDAGAVLDALVSIHVMEAGYSRGWYPSKKIDQAFQVVDRVLGRFDKRNSELCGSTDFVLRYYPYTGEWIATFNWSNDTPVEARALTAPHAICLAALAAIQGQP